MVAEAAGSGLRSGRKLPLLICGFWAIQPAHSPSRTKRVRTLNTGHQANRTQEETNRRRATPPQNRLRMCLRQAGRVEDGVFDLTGRPPDRWMHDLFYDGPNKDDQRRFVLGPPPRDPLIVGGMESEGLAFIIGQVLADAWGNARLTSVWTLQDRPSKDLRSTFRLDPAPALAVPSSTEAEAIAVLAGAGLGHGLAVACFGLFTGGSQTDD